MQLTMPRGADPEVLGSISTRFPAATTLKLGGGCPAERLAACLSALPDGSWPAVEDLFTRGYVAATAAAHAARLCPRLRQIGVWCWPGAGQAST